METRAIVVNIRQSYRFYFSTRIPFKINAKEKLFIVPAFQPTCHVMSELRLLKVG
jgi:hypothetical protein